MDTLLRTAFTRRAILQTVAGGGLTAAAALPLASLAGPVKAANYRGIIVQVIDLGTLLGSGMLVRVDHLGRYSRILCQRQIPR